MTLGQIRASVRWITAAAYNGQTLVLAPRSVVVPNGPPHISRPGQPCHIPKPYPVSPLQTRGAT